MIPLHGDLRALVAQALHEDCHGPGDVTSRAVLPSRRTAAAEIRSKGRGVAAGMALPALVYEALDHRVAVENLVTDGDRLRPGTVLCRLRGPARALLCGERTALNFVGHLSGIATATAALCTRIRHTHARLLDTRKTTPLLRRLEKDAVVAGGGANHRMGLYDMVLIKDTHIAAAGGITPALKAAASFCARHRGLKVEIEVLSFAGCIEALAGRPDRIMLDNMTPALMRRCVRRRNREAPAVELEASGNVKPATIRAIAETGVDFISCGSITHSAPALDIHMVVTS